MDAEVVRRVIAAYREKFAELQIEKSPFPRGQFPQEPAERLGHCFWMLDEIERYLGEDRIEKAMRWLGFVQGCLWSHGIFSVDDFKSHNHGE